MPFDTTSVRLPFEIAFDTGEIGGPSAGLAFTLTLLDELTAGDLLGGEDVAVTGTMRARRHGRADRRPAAEGVGGPPGRHRALPRACRAIRREMDTAREVAGDDVELIAVGNVDEALAALERLGGDPLPPTRGMTPTP